MIDKKIIDEINEKTDIVALVSNYVHLEKAGKNYKGICPFHDDTNPSFVVSPEKNISKCFSCNEGGAPIRFYQKINNVSFEEAVLALAEPLGIKIDIERRGRVVSLKEHEALKEALVFYKFNLHNTVSGEKGITYLKNRKLEPETIEHFNIGFSPSNNALAKLLTEKNFNRQVMTNSGLVAEGRQELQDIFKNRLMFPITDHVGNVVGFSGRTLDQVEPKYYNSPESVIFKKGEVLYHLYEALPDIRIQKSIILHEGFFDCIASYEAGIKNTVATMGTALTLKQAELLKRFTNHVILAFDGDKAGIEATYNAIDVLRQVRIRVDVLKFDEKLDPDDYVKKYGKEKYQALFKTELKDPYRFIYETNKESLNLKNANDIAILKNVVRDMLYHAPQSTKELYIKRLSEDLDVSVYSLSNLLTHQRVVEPKPVKKKEKTKIANKFYQAEQHLFINMFRSKELSARIEQALGIEYVCDPNIVKLRMLLHSIYYQTYDHFNEDQFIAIIKEEEDSLALLEALDNVFKTLYYQAGFEFTELEIEENIQVLKSINTHKEYINLLKEIKSETESYQKTNLLERQKELRLKGSNG